MKIPTKVNFDICTYCNHQCLFCSNSDERTLKNKVSTIEFIKVMDNITKYVKIKELGLSAKGEVLLNCDIVEIVKLAKEKYSVKYLYISTNGVLLNNKLSVQLLEAGLDSIKFSINGCDKDSYKKAHKKDDFEKVINNFNNLLELKKQKYHKVKIFISSIIDIEKNILEMKFKELFSSNYKFINDIFKYNITYTPAFDSLSNDINKLKPCSLVFNEIYIDSDCRLGLCCKDYFKEFDYGSLLQYDFKELYQSKEISDIREMHINKTFPNNHFCKKCLLFDGNIND